MDEYHMLFLDEYSIPHSKKNTHTQIVWCDKPRNRRTTLQWLKGLLVGFVCWHFVGPTKPSWKPTQNSWVFPQFAWGLHWHWIRVHGPLMGVAFDFHGTCFIGRPQTFRSLSCGVSMPEPWHGREASLLGVSSRRPLLFGASALLWNYLPVSDHSNSSSENANSFGVHPS